MSSHNALPRATARPSRLALLVLAAFASLPYSHAANLTWDPLDTTNGATIDPGAGIWDLTAGNTVWNNAGANVAWTQASATAASNVAIFGGTDGTYEITLATGLSANHITFNNSGYTLTAPSAVNFTLNATGPLITTATDKVATIGPNVAIVTTTSGNPISIAGGGTLNVTGPTTKIQVGANNLSLTSGPIVNVTDGASLISPSQFVIGTSTTATHLTVDGGIVTTGTRSTTSAQNIVLANSSGTAASSTLTIKAGSVTNNAINRGTGETGLRFGATAATTAAISGTVNLDGGTLTVARLYELATVTTGSLVSTINLNGGTLQVTSGALNAANFMNNLDAANVLAGGAFIDTNGVATTIAQPLLADLASPGGGLTKLGAGNLTLSGANTYTGPTTINAGALVVPAPYSSLTAVTVNSGGRLQITTGTSPSTLPGLTLNTGSGFKLDLGAYDSSRLATASFTSFDAAGDFAIDLSGSDFPVGSYTLFTYGTKSGTGVPSLGTVPPGVTGTIQDTGSSLILNVLTPQLYNFVWSAGTGDWDTSTANWTGLAYVEGSLVTFPDLAGSHIVNLTATRSPFSIAVQNNIGNTYTFSGASLIDSATQPTTLTKTGTGALTLGSPNTYTGATTVSSGALVVTSNDALGSTTGSTTLASGTSLALSSAVNYTSTEKIIGSGVGTLVANVGPLTNLQRGLVQSVSGHSTFAGPIELSAGGTTRFGVQDGAQLTLSGTISRAPGVTGAQILFRAGANDGDFITLSGTGNDWDGGTSIFSSAPSGALAGVRLGAHNALPVTGNITGASSAAIGTILDLNGYDQTINGLTNGPGVTANLAIQNQAPSTVSTLTLNPAADITDNATGTGTFVFDGLGQIAIVKTGLFKQTLGIGLGHTGPTTVSAGTLAFTGIGAMNTSKLILETGATVDVAAITATDFTLNAGLAGSGTFTATGKTVAVSTTFAPGALALTGTLENPANLTLAPGTASTLIASDSIETRTALTVSGALVLDGTLAITPAPGFSFASITTLPLYSATGGVTGTFTAVSVNGVALTLSGTGVWTGTEGPLGYTFTEATGTLDVSGGVVISPLQAWRDLYFPTDGNDGTGIGAPDADPDGDGIANLLEYATGTNPITANTSGVVTDTSTGKITLTYNRTDDPKLTYTVVGRNDLASGEWLPVTASNNPSAGGTTPVTVEDEVLISAQPKRFLRLEVTLAP